MYHEISLSFTVAQALEAAYCEATIAQQLDIPVGTFQYRKVKQSIDARKAPIVYHIQYVVYVNEVLPKIIKYTLDALPHVANKAAAVVVGAGPAGLFAALRLIELGVKPIVLERGKDVQSRRRDLAAINKDHIVNPESNYCFGEGGAGTYSDGKLYTRSKKRGDVLRILEILVAHGAKEDILYEAHPHIGTNKLPAVVAAMRQSILDHGGEIHFNAKVTDFVVAQKQLKAVVVNGEKEVAAKACILATGHSARDIYQLCLKAGIAIEAKPFAMGVRVEHSQQMIDSAQYKLTSRGPYLPAASYSLVAQTRFKGLQKGVFSFCMCPGGFIVPAATSPGELVVNGMSPSRRDSRFANSGIVVAIDANDWKEFASEGPLAAMYYQEKYEKIACQIANNKQTAPAQLLADFRRKKTSTALLDTSYQPGITSVEFRDFLPETIAEALKLGFDEFDRKIKGFGSNLGQIIGLESRTSAPVRIPRQADSLEHPSIQGLFPCGEGAGFAGGIVSAAMDGERCAEKLAQLYYL